MAEAILHGLHVVEIAGGIAGWSAGLYLSEAGAEVIRIETPGGDAASGSAHFIVLNRGKQRLALDLNTEAGIAHLRCLLDAADVFLHDLVPAAADALGLGDAALAARHPRLVVSAIGGWPRQHAWRDKPVRESLVLARLGILDEQPGHRPGPIYVRMPYANWIAGWLSAIAVMARLLARLRDGRDGRGGVAHTSLAQAALVPMTMHWSRAATPTAVFAKGLDKNTPIPLHRCADGRWVHVHYSPDKAPWMAQALAEMGPAEVAKANAAFPPSHVAPNFGANKQAMAKRPAADWVQHFWEHDVAAQIAAPFGEIYFDEQAHLNGYVVAVDDPLRGKLLQPGPAYRTSPPPRVRGPLRELQDVTGTMDTSPSERATTTAHQPAARAPLQGLKVLDLGAYLAGPFACMLLADLGAEVIKVEPPAGDAMRRLERIFAGTQRGKRGLALKLGDPASLPALDTLVHWADVVHHNVRMPAARKLGIDPERLLATKPSLICGHISTYGPEGPRADWPGFDQLMQAACGWEVECGGTGNPPMWLRFGVGDHLAALSCVFAVLLGLFMREATGQGQAVASSLLGAMLLTECEVLARPDGNVGQMSPLDTEQTGLSPGDRLYRCADGWLMVAAWTAAELEALHAVAGDDPPGWFARRSVTDAAAALLISRVPNEPALQDQREAFLDDPRHAGLHTRYRHAVYGELEQIGALWDFGDLPLHLDRPPPALGEHSRELLQAQGLSETEIERLVARGITRT